MNPIIALWSHPRSMSTAVERIMRERDDLDCFHEPFMYDYYVNRKVRQMPHFAISPEHPTTYEDIRNMLLERAESRPVFFKDMSYYVVPQMLDDTAFCRRVTHCFLIRNPMASILSYHKIDPDMTSQEVGLQTQWLHFSELRKILNRTPPVVEAETIRADTEGTISRMWHDMEIAHVSKAFQWSNDNVPRDWTQVNAWHDKVSSSQSIRKLSPEEAAANVTEFDKCAEANPHLKACLEHHLPFYLKLKTEAHRQQQTQITCKSRL